MGFEDSFVIFVGKVWRKKFSRAHVKVCILQKKPHGSTNITPEDQQKIFLCYDILYNWSLSDPVWLYQPEELRTHWYW